MGFDASKLMAHLAANLEAHADRDGLSEVARAVFLARGGHAPGTVCPSEPPRCSSWRCWNWSGPILSKRWRRRWPEL